MIAISRMLRGPARGLLLFTLLLLALVAGFVSERASEAFEAEIAPAYIRQSSLAGDYLAEQFEHAGALGVPIGDLVGVAEFLTPFLESQHLAYIAVTDPAGRILYRVGTAVPELESWLSGNPLDPAKVDPQDGIVLRIGSRIDVVQPIAPTSGGGPVAFLHLGVDGREVEAQIVDARWDIAILLLVSLLTAAELLLFVLDRNDDRPARLLALAADRIAHGNWCFRIAVEIRDEFGQLLAALDRVARRLNDMWARIEWKADEILKLDPKLESRVFEILGGVAQTLKLGGKRFERLVAPDSVVVARTPLFLYVFAEQLSASFMPLYARSVTEPVLGLPNSILIGLPIALFMAGLVVATPFGSLLSRRLGARRCFLIGAAPAIAGYVLTALVDGLPGLILCRLLSSIGYAFVTISCQSYLASVATAGNRARSMAVFVSAMMAGAMCGTAIGAVLADRFGYRATFLCSAALAACAVAFVLAYMPRALPAAAQRRQAVLRLSDVTQVLANRRFAALVAFAAIPAKMLLTGMVFYLAPLYLASQALSQPEIGRIVMAYGLTMLLTNHLGARLSDRFGSAPLQIALAGLLTGVGALAVLVAAPTFGILVAIVVLGACQGLASAPMLAIVSEICPEESRRLGMPALHSVLRLSERIGSVAGPVVAAILVASLGYGSAVVCLGAVSALTAVIYGVLEWTARSRHGVETVR